MGELDILALSSILYFSAFLSFTLTLRSTPPTGGAKGAPTYSLTKSDSRRKCTTLSIMFVSCVNRHLPSHSGGRTLLISRTEEFTLVLSYLI